MQAREHSSRIASPLIVALLSALAAFVLSVALLTGLSGARLAATLQPRLAGEMTIAVWGSGLESADAAAARAAELLGSHPGVRSANVLEPEESDAAVSQLMAGRTANSEPRLISVTGSPQSLPSAAALQRLLVNNHLAVAMDDHRYGHDVLESRTALSAALGAGLSVLLWGVLFIACLALSFGSVSASPRFDLVTRLGATPGYIARWMAARMALAALAGAVVGCACGDVLIFNPALGLPLLQRLGLPFAGDLGPSDAGWTIACLPLVAALAGIGGALGALISVRRQERRV